VIFGLHLVKFKLVLAVLQVDFLMNQGHPSGYDSGARSPRPETPEPSSIQGRRNTGAQLLDDEGGISDQACALTYVVGLVKNQLFFSLRLA
jgi:hypothetical protein